MYFYSKTSKPRLLSKSSHRFSDGFQFTVPASFLAGYASGLSTKSFSWSLTLSVTATGRHTAIQPGPMGPMT